MSGRQSVTYRHIYAAVRRIPRGRVATYGQIAKVAGLPGNARQVGYALHALPTGTNVPWHRVINAAGRISRRSMPGDELRQHLLLEAEGVRISPSGRIALSVYGWCPGAARARSRR